MKKGLKKTLHLCIMLALLNSCVGNVPNNSNSKSESNINSETLYKYAIRGKAEFPTQPQTPSLGLTPKGRGTNNSPFEGGKGDVLKVPSIRQSWKSLNPGNPVSEGEGYKTKATLGQVGDRATVSLIYPPDASGGNANVTIGTGLTDVNGNFTVNPTVIFNPGINSIYVLEASKRIGTSGNIMMSVRTYIKWNGSGWDSITQPSNLGVFINSKTTAITIIESYDSSVIPNDTMGKVDISQEPSVVSNIGSVTSTIILNVAAYVDSLLGQNQDPISNIFYLNNKYYVKKPANISVQTLIDTKNCPNCDLKDENLSSYNLSNGDLSNSTLTGANFQNANLTDLNLTGANYTNTNFTGATWTNGKICGSNSVGFCNLEFRANTFTTDNQSNPVTAMDSDGDFVIIWHSYNQTGDADAGVYGQRYNTAGFAQSTEFYVNSFTFNFQYFPSVAMDSDGDFVVVWQSNGQTADTGYGIFSQRFNSVGVSQGSEFLINTYTTSSQKKPAVAMDSTGNFVVVWQSYGQTLLPSGVDQGYGIFGQRYNSSGVAQGTEFHINTFTTGFQANSSIARDNDGDFVVVWQSGNQTGDDGYGIYAQRYTSSGATAGTEFRVNTYTTNFQANSSVAMDSTGNFVIVWQSKIQEGQSNYYGIYGQRYNSTGVAQGTEFRINSYTSNTQKEPSIAMDSDGDFVVTWQSKTQEGQSSYYGIFGQRYNSSGVAQGTEFIVNKFTSNNQKNPATAMDGSYPKLGANVS